MSHWAFVSAAYGVTLLTAAALAWISWRAMRGSERQ
ncbi:heme exporter protein CcmD [Sphingomonas aracearum]|uniref:Heme exporter protein CcmD n=1 Tax=Sphingomonas aracearum TaxID=2283317 RepID=A0A369VRY9_9SPHN|nr:heme exporter protein CcmD [Sphingomonas aracearum]RDE05144.1 heme exporter protein CcmD [Sphingomonas aracearum]